MPDWETEVETAAVVEPFGGRNWEESETEDGKGVSERVDAESDELERISLLRMISLRFSVVSSFFTFAFAFSLRRL